MSVSTTGSAARPRTVAQALAQHQAEHGLDAAVADLVDQAAATAPGFTARLRAAGLSAGSVTSVADLSALPVLTKDEMLALQAQDPPFGGMLADGADVVRVFQSPGPLYEPQLAGSDAWRWGQALDTLGVGPNDLVLNCFGYHLSPAGAMMEQGALAVGARVLPGGIGNQDLQVQAIADLGVTAYTGLPSYLHALIERYDAAGLDPDRWRLTRAMVTAEPLPDSLRAALEQRVPQLQMTYGTGETGLLAYETTQGMAGGLKLARGVLVQVCDLASGEPLTDETQGQVVVTLLRPDYPMVRFGTGDLSAWMLGPDGSPRLRGVLGRVGAAVKVKGMFLHPAQVTAVLSGVAGLAGHRLVIGREAHKDTLRCEVVPDGTVDPQALAQEVADRIRDGLRFKVEVAVVQTLIEGDGPLLDTRDWD